MPQVKVISFDDLSTALTATAAQGNTAEAKGNTAQAKGLVAEEQGNAAEAKGNNAQDAADAIADTYDSVTRSALSKNNREMISPVEWVAQLGAPTFDVGVTYVDGMYVNFTASTNQNLQITGVLTIGETYTIRTRMRSLGSNNRRVMLGSIFSSTESTDRKAITIINDFDVYEVTIVAGTTGITFGVASADNDGSDLEIDYLNVYSISRKDLEQDAEIALVRENGGIPALSTNDSEMISPVKWVAQLGAPTFDIQSTYADGIFIDFTASTNQSLIKTNVLFVGQTYNVRIRARSLGTDNRRLIIGSFFASTTGTDRKEIFITTSFVEHELTFVAGTVDLVFGIPLANNDGSNIEIDYLRVNIVREKDVEQDAKIESQFELITKAETRQILSDANSEFTTASSWVSGFGDPTANIESTNPEGLFVNFTTGGQLVRLNDVLTIGKTYLIKLTAYATAETIFEIGAYQTAPTEGKESLAIGTTLAEYKFKIVATTTYLGIGVLSANNAGADLYANKIEVFEASEYDVYQDSITDSIENVHFFHTEQWLKSISAVNGKPLVKIGVVGDSLMANEVGGVVPSVESPNSRIPLRLGVNSVSRRIYDYLSWNKPEFRRLDDADWTKSGTWTNATISSIFEPAHTYDVYQQSTTSSAYAEIIVPDGQENFAFVCHKDAGFGVLNITLNGGDISAYGESTVDLARTRGLAGDYGNVYRTVEYHSLPAGANTIRISKSADTTTVRIWGCFWWSGISMILQNCAHGGHSLIELYNQHLTAEVGENNFDAILFQLTVMNDVGDLTAPEDSVDNFESIYNEYLLGKDFLVMSTNPFGTDPQDGTPNYYALYTDPTMEQTTLELKKRAWELGIPFIDVFQIFKQKIIARGGTLEGGEGGLWYTWDGQHGSTAGVKEWWNIIRSEFTNKIFAD